jgi:hypothetical protein
MQPFLNQRMNEVVEVRKIREYPPYHYGIFARGEIFQNTVAPCIALLLEHIIFIFIINKLIHIYIDI